MDLIVRNVRLADRPSAEPFDIGVADGKIVAIERGLTGAAEAYDAGGRLGCAGLIETHIHLDKSRIIDRCPPELGREISPMRQVAAMKPSFTVEGLERGARAIGGAPRYDTDPGGQIRRIFDLAREYDVDIDIHLDVGNTP